MAVCERYLYSARPHLRLICIYDCILICQFGRPRVPSVEYEQKRPKNRPFPQHGHLAPDGSLVH
jgi:hypothetical protein